MSARSRQNVVDASDIWRLRFVARLKSDTPKTRAALRKAVDLLDDAIATHFETAYEAEYGRKVKR